MQTIDLSTDDDDVELVDSDRPPPRRASGLRRFVVRFILFLVFLAVAILVLTELSIALKMPALDPRPWLVKAARSAWAHLRPYLPSNAR